MKRLGVLEAGTGVGGAEINLFRLAPALQDRDWEVVVFVPGSGRLTEQLTRRGIRWIEVPGMSFVSTSRYIGKTKIPDPAAIFSNLIAVFRLANQLAPLFQQEELSALHTNSMLSHLTGGLAAKKLKMPCIWHLQDIVNQSSGLYLFLPLLNFTGRFLPQTIVCVSRAVAQQFWLKTNLRVVYNGVDTEKFTPQANGAFRTCWLDNRYTMIVGQVGRLTPWKGQDVLLALAQRAKNENLPIRFVIVGDDSFGLPGYQAELTRLSLRAGLSDQVLFVPWSNEMPDVYRSIDVLIHPVREPEPFGLVIAEAMACGKPVIFFDHGGIGEIVGRPECGIGISPGDVDAMWEAIKWAYVHRNETAEMGEKARQRILQEFTLKRFVDEMLSVYEEAVKTHA